MGGYIFSHPYDNDNTGNSVRINNSIKFTSRDVSGLQFGGQYGFSNSTGFSNNRSISAGFQYTNASLQVAAAYLDIDNPSGTANGAVSVSDANFFAQRYKVYGAGLNYSLGAATFGLIYTASSLKSPTSTTYISGSIVPVGSSVSSLKFRNYEVNARYQVTPALLIGGQYVYTTASMDSTS